MLPCSSGLLFKVFEVEALNQGHNAAQIIKKLKSIFSRNGIPLTVMSDNGPPYNSQEFKEFLRSWDINHITSSPLYPRSNGQVERTIQTVKDTLKKCVQSKTDPYIALLNLRNTRKGEMPSPSQLLNSRSLRTRIPCSSKILRPKTVSFKTFHDIESKNKNTMKFYHDRNVKSIRPFVVGENILFKKHASGPWIPGTIFKKTKQPRSFIVKSEEGVQYRRNQFHIIKSNLKKNNINNRNVSHSLDLKLDDTLDTQAGENPTPEAILPREPVTAPAGQESDLGPRSKN